MNDVKTRSTHPGTPIAPGRTAGPTILKASHAAFLAERPPGADEDVHMLSAIADYIIETYSSVGDLVFDPFAGFGTSLERALALGRHALGIELLPERIEHTRARLPDAHLIEGDARELLRLVRQHPVDATAGTGIPASMAGAGGTGHDIRLVLTSPPFMTENHHDADPLTAYELNGGEYRKYLAELSLVAAQCARIVAPGGFVVWSAADIHYRGHTTRLIHDWTRMLRVHLTHIDTIEVRWDRYPHDLVADALLVFQRPE